MARIQKLYPALFLTTALALPLAGCVDDMGGMKAEGHSGHGSHGSAAVKTPLLDTLGTHSHKITTSSAEAQAYFDQGYRQLFNFNHGAAIAAFQEALKRDPNCAMCWWGIAFAHGPNINMPMMPDAVAPANEAIANAQRLAGGASAAERDYIAALAKRYSTDPKAERAALDKAFAAAMREVAAKYPDDLDAQVLYAESLMDTTPWDYWQADNKRPHPGVEELVPTIEAVLKKAPNHPGAIHLYIHAVEKADPKRAEKPAEKLAALMPGAGHIVHMPTHIYNRVGRYEESVELNKQAARADETYFNATNDRGMYAGMYYIHNLHFVWTAATTEGRSATALEYAKMVVDKVPTEMAREVPAVENFKPTLLYSQLRFGRWDEVLATPAPDKALRFATAIWHYARARAFAAKGDLPQAKAEFPKIESSFSADDAKRFAGFGVPGEQLVKIAANVTAADIALAEGRMNTAIAKLRIAVRTQETLPYMEPPWWDFPVRQYLGAALLKAGQAKAAEAVYREDLREWKQNGWSLFGLSEALKHQRKARDARAAEASFKKAWARADVELAQSRF
ncbi:MAG: tetratricopeptide repeat protein [Micropepsaceae bacterium]